MPNYVRNIIFITAKSQERLDEVMKAIKFDDSEHSLDFNKIIEMPKALDIGDSSYIDSCVCQYMSACNPDNGVRKHEQKHFVDYMMNPSEYNALKEMILNSSRYKYMPLTDNIKISSLDNVLVNCGKEYIDIFLKHGYFTWYDWCISNWGTKWNSFHYDELEDETPEFVKERCEETPFTDYVIFDTAWNAPHPVIEKFAELYPDLELHHGWSDEDTACNLGTRDYANGEIVFENEVPKQTKEAYELYAKIWDEDLEYSGYIFSEEDGTYHYDEDRDQRWND